MLARPCRSSLKLFTNSRPKPIDRRFVATASKVPSTPSHDASRLRADGGTKFAQERAPSDGATHASQVQSEPENFTAAGAHPRVIFSGIQPTGVPHLGNYIGALRQWKQYHDQSFDPAVTAQRATEQYFSIVDLHALTASMPRAQRRQMRKESYASLLAMGLRNTGSTAVFFQSDVSYHSQLMWILSNVASTGYLSRMTQWKSKLNLPMETSLDADDATAVLKLGLFSYPVLQAADILLYDTTLVPVGHDQLQHIEFSRTLARGFNAYLAESQSPAVFTLPTAVLVPGKRIMSLRKPTQKMSKSDPDSRSQIAITDSPDEIRLKIKGATTDSVTGISYDPEKRPGVSNLIEIYKHTTEAPDSCTDIAKDCQNLSMQGLKDMVAQAIIDELRDIRPRFLQLMNENDKDLPEEIQLGANRARNKASVIFQKVQKSLGLS